jgi:hypothetical protein
MYLFLKTAAKLLKDAGHHQHIGTVPSMQKACREKLGACGACMSLSSSNRL